eukprot:1576192-Rhodomonas_salina.1
MPRMPLDVSMENVKETVFRILFVMRDSPHASDSAMRTTSATPTVADSFDTVMLPSALCIHGSPAGLSYQHPLVPGGHVPSSAHIDFSGVWLERREL